MYARSLLSINQHLLVEQFFALQHFLDLLGHNTFPIELGIVIAFGHLVYCLQLLDNGSEVLPVNVIITDASELPDFPL